MAQERKINRKGGGGGGGRVAGAVSFEGHFQWRPGSTNDWRWQREEDGNDTESVGELERRLDGKTKIMASTVL